MRFITMKNIGYNGRLGNQMFQHAAIVGLSKKYNLLAVHPNHDFRLTEVFDVKTPKINDVCLGDHHFQVVDEPRHGYCPDLLPNEFNHVDLNGYFQTEKYWNHCSETIRNSFVFKDKTITETAKKCVSLFGDSLPTVAIGVRRTDYLESKNADCLSLDIDYYARALNTMYSKIGKATYIVVSDDPQWCSWYFKQFGDYGRFFVASEYFNHPTQDLVEMAIMRETEHAIIPNSTFHWWGSWLNENNKKIVVIPAKWFSDSCNRWNQNTDIAWEDSITC